MDQDRPIPSTINLETSKTESHYQIFSNSGQVITTGILNATGTAFQKYLDLSSLSSGVYVNNQYRADLFNPKEFLLQIEVIGLHSVFMVMN